MISHYQVAEATFLFIYRESFALQTYLRIVLRSGAYLQFNLPVEGIHGHVSTQYGSVQVDVDIGVQVVILPFKGRVIAYCERPDLRSFLCLHVLSA